MERYGNIGGNSNVTRYQINNDSVIVEFGGRAQYKYSLDKCGQEHFNQLKELALNGQGLNSFTSRNCKKCPYGKDRIL